MIDDPIGDRKPPPGVYSVTEIGDASRPYILTRAPEPVAYRPPMPNSRAALAEYDRTKPDRDAMSDAIETQADLDAWLAAERQACDLVTEAFFRDTADRNSRANAKLVSIQFVRECVALAGGEHDA